MSHIKQKLYKMTYLRKDG